MYYSIECKHWFCILQFPFYKYVIPHFDLKIGIIYLVDFGNVIYNIYVCTETFLLLRNNYVHYTYYENKIFILKQ